MDNIWLKLYSEAKKVLNPRNVSPRVEAGGVAAAILSESGKIYTGVCVDTCCSLGVCAERNAIFNMLTCGDSKIQKVVAVMGNGSVGAPCGACRELMAELMPDYRDIEILVSLEPLKTVSLGFLTPMWWI